MNMERKFIFTPKLRYTTYGLMIIGIIAIVTGFLSDGTRALANLLLNNYYFLCLAIGASFFLALQYITQAGWSSAFKRIPESMGTYIPWAALIMVLIMIGMSSLYPWINPVEEGFDEHSIHVIEHKSPFLNVPFFLVRLVIYFAVWVIMTRLLRKYSLKEDIEGGTLWFEKTEFYSKVFIFTLALTFSLASFDWIMSIDPTWYSTIFALKNFVTSFYHGSALIVLIVAIMHHYGYFQFITDAHWQDFSKYVFILSILWAYFWFSQYLLIWYANIPEETIYYVKRVNIPWKAVFYLNLILNWTIPFMVLLSNYFARKKMVLGIVIIFVMIGLWFDLFEQIMPGVVGEVRIGFTEIGTYIGFAGLFLYVFMRTLGSVALIPANHPYLKESLHHTGH